MKNGKVKVLHVMGGANHITGIASYLYQQYKNIDSNKVHYDFLFAKENSMKSFMKEPCFSDSHFFELKDNIKNSESINYLKLFFDLRWVLREKEYDVIVVNTSVIEISLIGLLAAKSLSKKIAFISHAHNAGLHINNGARRKKLGLIINLVSNFCKFIVRNNSDFLFACSKDAGRITFGENSIKQSNFKIINNAIDLRKFSFSKEIRKKIRQNMLINDSATVFGNIGSLIPIKNQTFLLKVFAKLHEKNKNSELWLIGDGSDKLKLEKETKDLSIDKYVKFLGERQDVNELLQAMDAFVFTSLSEGLGIVAIESQAAGLPTFVSDGIPDDVLITKIIQKISLTETPNVWANKIIDTMNTIDRTYDTYNKLAEFGFDIKKETEKVVNFYIDNFSNHTVS